MTIFVHVIAWSEILQCLETSFYGVSLQKAATKAAMFVIYAI